MKAPIKSANTRQSGRLAYGLTSAAVILSLTACGGDTLDSLSDDLANGEDVNINLSTNDDGNLVVSLNDGDSDADDDTGGASFDESIDGDITGDANNPLPLDLAIGSNVLSGSVVAGDIDYVTVNVEAGYVLSGINLLSYDSETNQSFIGIQTGTIFTEPPVDTVVGNLLGFTLMNASAIGTNILPAIGTGQGAQGFTGPLGEGDYTFWIQETGPVETAYSLDLTVSLADEVTDTPADDDNTGSEAGSFQVTFTNLTQNQLMTPPVVALHDPSVHLFQVGEVASDAIQVIAEMGNNTPLVEFASANPNVVSAAGVAGDGPFGAGDSVTLNLTTSESGQVFSAVNMIICSNDGISGVDSYALPEGSDPVVILARPYDAGTRINQNDVYSFFPPPCRTNTAGDLVDVIEAPLETPRAAIGAHAGQFRTTNTALGRNWDFATDDDVLMIEIVRN